jgi:hypothetical protein
MPSETSDRYGHLYDSARLRLRDHLDATYGEGETDVESASRAELHRATGVSITNHHFEDICEMVAARAVTRPV